MTHTQQCKLDPDVHQALCGLAAGLIKSKSIHDWRHNNLGLLQAYIHEGEEQEMRLHVWHESLRKPGIEESGLYHDHRFDLNSVVLVGEIRQKEIETEPREGGSWMMYEVLHARAAHEAQQGASFHQTPQPLPGEYVMRSQTFAVPEGWSYTYPKAEFHGTYFEAPLTITLLTKSRQQDFKARILAPRDRPLVHAFEDTLPALSTKCLTVLKLAHDALMQLWKAGGV